MLRLRSVAHCISTTLLAAFSLLPLSVAQAQGAGYWHTSGSTILDANNQPVRIAGINWYGFETRSAVLNGLAVQDYKTILTTVKAQGYNALRIPLSSQMIEAPATELGIGFSNAGGPINADLSGLNSMQVLDKVVDYAGSLGLKIILDHHRSEAGSSAESNGLWYTNEYPETAWIADWVGLANRYAGNPTVIGFDLHNEPHMSSGAGACWDCGGAADWHLAAERAGNAVLGVNPNLLIFVEGVNQYGGDWTWWGGNLEGVARSPVVLSEANHLVYSPHEYGPNESSQKWFNGSTSYASLVSQWSKSWGYISENRIAPVWVGEFGTTNQDLDLQNNVAGSQGQWFQSFVHFLSTNENISWNYWAVNGEDNYGLLDSGYGTQPVSVTKQAMLAGIQMPLAAAPAGARAGLTATDQPIRVVGRANDQPGPGAPAGLTALAAGATLMKLAWVASATLGVGYVVYAGKSSEGEEQVVASGVTGISVEVSGLQASNVARVTTRATMVPAAPSGLSASVVSGGEVALEWAASASDGVTYNVYGSTTPGGTGSLLGSTGAATSFRATGLKGATMYYFTVRAVANGLISSASNSASETTPVAAPAPVACRVKYEVKKDWGSGFEAGLTITNTGSVPLSSWTLSWTYSGSQQVTQSWDGSYTQRGEVLRIANAGFNGTIASGATNTGIGFLASYAGTNAAPSAFYLNGVACTAMG